MFGDSCGKGRNVNKELLLHLKDLCIVSNIF